MQLNAKQALPSQQIECLVKLIFKQLFSEIPASLNLES